MEPQSDLHFEIEGQGTTRLVLLHGFGSSRETWRDVAPLLAADYTLYLVDLKGHGLSPRPRDGKYSIADHAAAVTAFLREEKLGPIVLVGHSLGGAVALMTYFNLRQPGRAEDVRAIILIDSAGYRQSLPFFVTALRRPVLNWLMLNTVPAEARAKYTLSRIFADRSRVDSERVQRYARYLRLPGSNYALVQTARNIIPPDLDEFVARIPGIEVPALLIWGAADEVTPLSIAKRFEADLPDARLAILPKCGHLPQEECPVETAALIRDFIRARLPR